MHKYKCLFWDFDGTIVDSFEGCSFAFGKVFEHYGVNIAPNDRKRFIGPPLKDTFTDMFGENEEPKATALYREYYINQGGNAMCKLFDGIDVALSKIKNLGYKMYIATSKREDVAKEMLQKYGIADVFDNIFGTVEEEGRIDKKDILKHAFNLAKIDIKDCLMIGDSIYDVMASKHIGMDCLAVEYGFGNLDDMKKLGIVASVSSVEELVNYFDK